MKFLAGFLVWVNPDSGVRRKGPGNSEAPRTREIEIEDWCCGYGAKNSWLRIDREWQLFFTA